MDDTTQNSQTLFPHETGHHRSARERQRKGPMWGCLKFIFFGAGGLLLLIFLIVAGGYLYLGSSSFADLVSKRIAQTLSTRLGRNVTIGKITIVRTHPQKVIINDLRISNSPGAVSPYFATVRQVEITGGVESFWGRQIQVDRVDIHDPHLFFEIYPAGSALTHNFPHWQPAKQGKYEIYHLQIGKMFVDGGAFSFNDRRHNITADAVGLTSETTIALAQGVYEGVATSPRVRIQIQDYVPFDLNLRGGFRYSPGVLALKSIALHGQNMQVFLSGKLDPLTEGAYNLKLAGDIGLDRVREIFRVQKLLDGRVTLDGNLRGKAGDFHLTSGFVSQKIVADAYELTTVKGKLDVTGDKTIVDVQSARYGGGSVSAHYVLPKYAEPYPMSVDLRYDHVSIEKLFADWGIRDTGLRGAGTGKLTYGWNKDKILAGSGEGTATLSKDTVAFSNAKYPIALGGSTDFALANGVITFRRGELITDASLINLTGTLRIEDVFTNLDLKIHSSDFSELDRAAFNFAQSAGKKTYTLLGLGGAGDITGTVQGRIKTPDVVAHIASTATKYNNILLGDADIDLTYAGLKNLLTFKRAIFSEGKNSRLALTGTLEFPDTGPSPRFDLAVDATNYPVDRAIATVNLKLNLNGMGTGKMLVTGTPEAGKVTFLNMIMHQKSAELRLNGDVIWAPGTGNVRFNLDIAAQSFPVADIAAFLDVKNLPVTGDLTGTLHLEGPKSGLGGQGRVTVKNGSIYDEPVDVATADIAFTQGTLRATNLDITSPAGQITGEAELNLNTNKFSYIINSSSVDISKLKIASTLAGLFGGKLKITSSGGGTFDRPELVLEATLNDAAIRGLALPPDAPPPTLYVAIRNGQLVIRGSAANVLSIDGTGTVGQDFAVDGNVRITITDIAKLVALSPNTATLPAAGNAVIDLRLSGKLSSLEALRIDATVPTLDLRVADHQFTAARPLRLGVRDGRFTFDDFQLKAADSIFALTGFAELIGTKRIAVGLRGRLEAALLQLFVRDLRADGHINLAADVTGTMNEPRITGTAELQGAQFRFAGFPQLIDNVTGTLIFRGDRIEIDSLRATVGGGTIVAGGFVTTQGLMPKTARITLQGNNVAIRYFEGVTVEGNFNLVASGDADRILLQGDVAVNRALYFKDFNFQTSLLNVLLSRRGVFPLVAANWQDRVSLRVHLTAPPDTLAVRNNIADVTGSAEIDVNGTLSNPVVLGLVTLNEGGRVRFQNIDYNVVRGSINFQNPFRIDPFFDITLEGRLSGGIQELESGPVDVTVNLVGTLDRFTPSVTSDPPASDITLFSLLGVGGLFNRTSSSPTPNVDATLAGKSLLYQSLGSLVGSKILPFVDSFTVDPGLLDTNDPGPKVAFERRLSNSVRLLVIYNLHDSKTRAVLEWQVNNDWTLQFTRDEIRKEFRVEARFRRRYKGHWTFGGNRQPVTMFASLSPVEGSISDLPAQPSVPPAAGAITATGPIVREITYRADSHFDTSVLGQYVQLRAGEPLSVRAMQGTIKSLFATGDFRDVRIETTPAGDGVAVTLLLFVNYRIADVTFDGLRGSIRDHGERELTVHIGDVLSLNAVDRSADAIHDYLNRNGYLEATVDPETTFVRQTSRANVVFHVTSGVRAKVASVNVEGNIAPFTPPELLGQMKRGPGRSFTVADARSDADHMAAYMYRHNYRKAEVRYIGETYDTATHAATLRYSATAGPGVQVAVEGVPKGAVRRLLPFRKNQGYSEDVIDTAANAIVKQYQEHGYFNATVDTEGKLEGNVWTTTFHVAPGEQFKLTAVTFSGNQKIPVEKLRAVTTTAPKGGVRALLASLLRRPSGVTRAQLNADRDAVESYYRLEGFSEATVATPVVITDTARHTLTVDFPIVEGPQTIVSAVTIEGNEQVPAGKLPTLQLKPGQPLNPALLRGDLIALQTFYSDRGNAEVQITPRAETSADKTSSKISYVIAEGPKISVDQVVVRGNTYTKTNVILTKSDIDRGDAFSYRSILEAQRNLYSLGIFQRVDIQAEQAGTSVSDRNVTISVEEGKDLTVSGSVGLTSQTGQSLALLGSASIAHRNLFGTGRYLGLQLIAAGKQRQEAFLTYREPFVFGYDVPVQITLFQSDEFRPRAHIQQRGTFIEATKIARFQTRWSARYEYKISDCLEDPENIADLCTQVRNALIPGLDRSITNVKISSVTPTFFWDRRDDSIDPHRGFFTSASVEYAFPVISATANFMKEFAQVSYYLPVTQRSVFAVSTRVGLIQPLGHDPVSADRLMVPLSERFTAGGETSHRGFRLDLLGTTCADPKLDARDCKPTLVQLVDENGKPGPFAALGGNSLFITNAEYRFPLVSTLTGAVFVDIGNIYHDTVINFGDLRYGAGAGLRYISPIGPLRFDIGLNPKPRLIGLTNNGDPLREDRYLYFITLGHAF